MKKKQWYVVHAYNAEEFMILITDDNKADVYAGCFSTTYDMYTYPTLLKAQVAAIKLKNLIT
ncbi:hypothetical protein HZF08_07750 [Paenibacillus sp. CGMCC 1.16610]|uniref:Phage protein n=1 Tax=Paenibacillus anseongense TaxID=2682845 RepID=A0ABW9UFS7_9BACL|nr:MULTISPECIES: hypothetical protein [Paenibacillus]MBA2938197.1 hypothetical protein [Paenibacillus sp. CGMCC 1.16610]MVQ37255.1 hypothetical protein [Paenibacillus anseongense]